VPRRKPKSAEIVVIAGPNGAGKTTFAQEFLPRELGWTDFVNADLIARGLSPFAPEKAALQAGRIMLDEIARRVAARQNFAFETTLSGLNYARHVPRWRKSGYHVTLIFLSLPSADLAVARVRMRVAHGGHSVPDSVIRRRFDLGLRNFRQIYCKIVDSWVLLDNAVQPPKLIDEGPQ